MKSHARAVVIGGGAIGVSILYHLAKAGWNDSVLVEKNELTSGSTWMAAGNCSFYHPNYYETKVQIASVELYQALEAETGQPTGWHTTGAIRLGSNPDRMDELKYNATKDRCLGLNAEMIGPDEIKKLHPMIQTDGLSGGLYHPDDGDVDPYQVTQAMAIGARNNGAEIYRFTMVTDISRTSGGEWVVHTDKGDITCETIVNAGGLWAPEVGRMVGLNIPSVACEHHHILFEKMDAVADRSEMLPLVRDPDESYYLRQEGDSLLLGMYENRAVPWYPKGVPWDYAQRELPTDLDRILPYVEACIHRVPIMEHAGMKHVTCGPITYTPNADPLVGPAFPLRNFWLCCGYSFGITQAGGIGKYLVEWIVDGYPSTDLWPVDPRRYGEYASHQYLLDKVADTYPRIYDIPFPNQERDAGRPVKTTPIYPRLKAANAAFGEMYGWERPNWFAPQGATPKDVDSWRRTNWHDPVGREVKAVNEGVGVLDMSGFAKFLVSGPGAEAYLDRLSCNKVPTQIGRIAIFPTLTDKGTFLCDMTVTKLADDQFVIVSAAMATDHDHHQLLLTLPDDGSVTLEDVTTEIGCLVVAGPKSRDVLAKLTEADLSNQGFPFATMRRIEVAGVPVQANRLNFVGELGWELFQKIEQQLPLYDAIMEAGQEFGIVNFGIRAMNSMRLEKGYCTWKGELNTLHTPWEAGLGWQVKLDKGDFIGKDALIEQKEQGVPQKLVLMAVEADNADGYGYNGVYKDGRYVGMTSSGGYGWRVDKSLCMAYIEPELAEVGTRLEVEILDQRHSALVVPIPFYDPKNERMKA